MSMIRYSQARPMFGLVLALMLAGCGDDNSVPFNPEGTSEDLAAVSAGFDSPATESFGFFGAAMDGAFAAPVLSRSLETVRAGTSGTGMIDAARNLARSARAMTHRGSAVALAIIPAEYLGDTYTFNETTSEYELSDRTGAPANGVRFILYSVNPVTGQPTLPLQEIGYADVLDESNAAADALRVLLVSEGTTYLNYGVSGTGNASSATVIVDGFVTNGTTQVNFDLSNTVSELSNGTIALDYGLDVPSRDVNLNYDIEISDLAGSADADIDLALSGPHGDVGIAGTLAEATGSLTFRANGDDFAVMQIVDEELESVTKPDGTALTLQEAGAVAAIWGLVLKGFDVFEDLLQPIDNLI